MSRKPRLFVSGATYHVYSRVARGEFVFDDLNEAAEFIEVVAQVRDLVGGTNPESPESSTGLDPEGAKNGKYRPHLHLESHQAGLAGRHSRCR